MAKQTFTTGQVLTAAQMTSLQQTAMGGGSTTAKTASYVLVAADAGTVVQMNSASATTITVNTALFAAGDTVQIQNVGAGVCTVTAGTATVSTSAVLALKQYDAGSLYFNTTSAALFFAADAADTTSPLTTKGDIYTFSTTNDRLPVGTNAQTLVADSTASTGLKWATPSAGALTLINSTTFSAVSSQSFNSVFTSTYKNYKIVLTCNSDTNAAELRWRYRVSGTDVTTGYRTALFQVGSSNTTQTLGGATTYITLGLMRGGTGYPNGYDMTVYIPNEASYRRPLSFTAWGAYGNPGTDGAYWGAGDELGGGAAYDGFTLIGNGGTISGTMRLYGLAN